MTLVCAGSKAIAARIAAAKDSILFMLTNIMILTIFVY